MKHKKRMVFIIIVMLALVGSWLIFTHKNSDTIIEAIEEIRGNVDRIIYQTEVENGVVVFYENNVGDDAYTINAEFVKHNLFGWKWVYGGGFSGYSGQYFQSVSGTPFPMIFGEVKNNEIEKIKVLDKEHNETKLVDIVGNDDHRIWYIFLDETSGPNFDIMGMSASGEIVESISFNITNLNF